ncbi:heparan-alpha-glucosaminide N-acetyltransferase-like isoform X2 [Aphidius gifuensis]|uniref:heparan-alpha-glucosaminide N-acetyltransferase-like isoform X2 n=1 Tax=Aphidius gifuensis TaxID=684658 RepID=UPI001CDD0441|nr:heparan-alpha-glucosaminide N-acetyltransferase-like isoform X2 [Aphidius gifuensis]
MEQFSGIHLEVPSCEEAVNSSLNHACIIIDNQKSNCDWKFISRAHLSGNDFENHLKIPQHSLRTIKVNADYYYKWIIANNTIENLDSSYSERLCILMMIFVNDGAGGYTYLNHSPWNGIYLADLVFPCFIWIMGFCIPMSIKSLRQKAFTSKMIYKKIVIRSVLLFCIGISLNSLGGNIQLENIRIFGVLQRCAVGYFVVSITYSLMSFKDRHHKRLLFRMTYDIIVLMPQWIIMVIILSSHWYFTFYHEFTGCKIGYVGPGGNSNRGSNAGCPGGAAGYMDRKILGANHLLKNSIVNMAFGSGPFEPEGILGCLTTIFHTFLGLQAGITLMSHKGKWKYIIFKFIVWSLLFGLSGLYLHCYLNVPINKNLWSLSFVLVTTSIAFVAMLMILILVDVLKWWEGGPFRIPGMNALILYIGSQVFYQTFPFHWKYGENMDNNRFLSLSVAVWDTGLWSVIAYIMHHNKLYVNL